MQEKLIILKETHNLNNRDMGKVIGVTPVQYRRKEKGTAQFKLNEMYAIAKYFNKNLDDIFLPSKHQNGNKKGR